MADYGAGDDVELEPDLLAYVEERLGHPLEDESEPSDPEEGDEPDEDDGEPEGEPEPGEGEPEPAETPAAALQDADLIEVEPGVVISRAQAKSYKQFEAILAGDAELQNLIRDRIENQGPAAGVQPPVPATPAAPPLPELSEEDLEDPTIRALYDAAKAQEERYAQQEQQIRALTDVTVTRENEEIQHLVNVQKQAFQTTHSLTPDEMSQVEQVALRLNVIPGLMSGVDPVTGQVIPRDRSAAITRAYEIAYNWLPEFRDRAIEAAVLERAKSTKRKQKLAGISGSSGSVPKNTPIRNATDRRNAMIAEVAGMMGQDSQE